MAISMINSFGKTQWTAHATGRYMITMMVLLCYVNLSGGQFCTDSVDVQQDGNITTNFNELAIIPYFNFTCNGTITSIRTKLFRIPEGSNYPFFQVWRAESIGSTVYSKIGEIQLQSDDQLTQIANAHWEANITLTGNNTIEVQPGDVVGYYHPPGSRYLVIGVPKSGYSVYVFKRSSTRNSVVLHERKEISFYRQPLLQFIIGIQCHILSTPANAMMMCSSGRVGVRYEGDTCNFTCNTGYELTGSDTRTCQSDGSWSGSDDVCRRVSCLPLNNPNNAIINCSLGDDGVLSYEDTCSFTCNAGYVLTGSYTKTCQSDGSWSGTIIDDVCGRVSCSFLNDPDNGVINCALGEDGVPYYEDTCSFTCNTGYELTGSDTRTCQSDGSWSGSDDVCRTVSCSILNEPNNGMINCTLEDDRVPLYEDTCNFTCNTGYELTGSDTRTCQIDGSWSGSMALCRGASEISKSGLSFTTIGAAVGGILFFIIIIIAALIVVLCIKQSHRKKTQLSEETKSNKDSAAHDYQNITIDLDNKTYEKSIVIPPSSKPIYEEPSVSHRFSILDTALSNMRIYESQYESSVDWSEVSSPSSQEMPRSIEEEEGIYSTPCEDEETFGPIYCEPPCDEHKIHAEFEGKKFNKLYHKEIWSLEELGTGEFGVVTRGKWKPSNHKEVDVAVKMLNTDASDKDKLRFLQEAVIMCQFDHQNVIKLHGVVTETPAMIVLEYMSRGNLKNMLLQLQHMSGIAAHGKFPLVLLKFCKEIAAGMTYLSGKQFIHRDLAARNILVSDKIVCKIADFGMSRDLINENYYITSGGKIPVKWTAPEALHYRKYSVQSDVWSYGCVLYEIWSLGNRLYGQLTNTEVIEKLDSGYRLPPPPGCPRTIYRIMIKCWNPDPRLRPQFGQIMKLLSGKSGYLLGWSDEDKWIGGEDAMKLGAPLGSAKNLYYDLQLQYKQIEGRL